MRQQTKAVPNFIPNTTVPARWPRRKHLVTALAITALLGGCAFYGEISSLSDMPHSRSGPPSMKGTCTAPHTYADNRPPPCYR